MCSESLLYLLSDRFIILTRVNDIRFYYRPLADVLILLITQQDRFFSVVLESPPIVRYLRKVNERRAYSSFLRRLPSWPFISKSQEVNDLQALSFPYISFTRLPCLSFVHSILPSQVAIIFGTLVSAGFVHPPSLFLFTRQLLPSSCSAFCNSFFLRLLSMAHCSFSVCTGGVCLLSLLNGPSIPVSLYWKASSNLSLPLSTYISKRWSIILYISVCFTFSICSLDVLYMFSMCLFYITVYLIYNYF